MIRFKLEPSSEYHIVFVTKIRTHSHEIRKVIYRKYKVVIVLKTCNFEKYLEKKFGRERLEEGGKADLLLPLLVLAYCK